MGDAYEAGVFACARCGHRQAEDATCTGCGEGEALDLRRGATRDYLDEVEARHRDRLTDRIRLASVLGGMAVVFALWLIPGYFTARNTLNPGLPFFADQWILAGLIALGLMQLAERRLVRPKFPWRATLPPPEPGR